MRRHHARAAAKPHDKRQAYESDPVDIGVLRRELALRLTRIVSDHLQSWRVCGEPACKRGRKCCAPRGLCSKAGQSLVHADPEQVARAMAMLKRRIGQRLDQFDAEQAVSADRSHEKS